MTIRSWSDDPRAIQLRRRFETALMALARQQALDTITVEAVCDRADLGRHSFFQVFETIDDARGAVRSRLAVDRASNASQ
jgi:hypothetical protein